MGAVVFAAGVHGMTNSAEFAEGIHEPQIVYTESQTTAASNPNSTEAVSLIWDHWKEPRVIIFGVVAVAGLVTVVAPNLLLRNRSNNGRSRSSGGDGLFGIDFGGDGDGDGGD